MKRFVYKRIILFFVLVSILPLSIEAYNRTYNVKVGETFTVYTTYHSNTTAILWTIPYTFVEPIGYVGPAATSVTFRAVKKTSGEIIQAITYADNRRAGVDDWYVCISGDGDDDDDDEGGGGGSSYTNIKVTGIELNKSELSLYVDEEEWLYATVLPNNATNKSVSWTSSNSSVATVSSSGLVTAKGIGWTKITCWANDDRNIESTCMVTVSSIPVVIAEINSTNFPDANFRNYLLEQEYGKDGALTDEEINARSYMDVSSKEITSLVGIEYFTVLKDLRCNGNHLTTLDVSKNTALETLQCYNNKLSSLDISKNTKLDYLDCHGNNLSALDVSNSPKMRVIVLNENSISGTAMDNLISSLPDKVGLFCVILPSSPYEENICTKVQVAAAKTMGWSVQYRPSRIFNNWEEYEGTNLATVNDVAINAANFPDGCFRSKLLGQDYGKDGILTKEEIEGIVEMNIASIKYNGVKQGEPIKSLKGIEFFTALKDLYCSNNELTSLDVSKNAALKTLQCYDNQLISLNVSGNTALQDLWCNDNQLSTLDVTHNTALKSLSCYNNQLSTLDVTHNTALKSLSCYNNQLTSLNISGNTALQTLWCNDNQLSTLDVTHNTALVIFHCYGNQLSGLDMSHNERIHYFNCANNRIKDLSMDLLISSLRTITGDKYEFYILRDVLKIN